MTAISAHDAREGQTVLYRLTDNTQARAKILRICKRGRPSLGWEPTHAILQIEGRAGTHWEPLSRCEPAPHATAKAEGIYVLVKGSWQTAGAAARARGIDWQRDKVKSCRATAGEETGGYVPLADLPKVVAWFCEPGQAPFARGACLFYRRV